MCVCVCVCVCVFVRVCGVRPCGVPCVLCRVCVVGGGGGGRGGVWTACFSFYITIITVYNAFMKTPGERTSLSTVMEKEKKKDDEDVQQQSFSGLWSGLLAGRLVVSLA